MEIGGLTDFGKENLAGQIKGRRQGYGIFHDFRPGDRKIYAF